MYVVKHRESSIHRSHLKLFLVFFSLLLFYLLTFLLLVSFYSPSMNFWSVLNSSFDHCCSHPIGWHWMVSNFQPKKGLFSLLCLHFSPSLYLNFIFILWRSTLGIIMLDQKREKLILNLSKEYPFLSLVIFKERKSLAPEKNICQLFYYALVL